jgi:Cof subfamily protein (haloacid dehalogenase superfamily)
MIKAVFFDIDGTLISDKYIMPESTKMAIEEMRQKGIKVFIATGRSIMQIKKLPMASLEFDGYITLNGQLCLNGQGEIFYESPLEETDRKAAEILFAQKEIPFLIVEKDRIYINFLNHMVCHTEKEISMPLPKIGEYHGEKIYQLIVHGNDATVQKVMSQLPNCKFTRWHMRGVDVISKKGGKVTGIREILKKYAIRQEETMAFGDGDNDAEMLKFAGIGVAMGNANAYVKDQADYITKNVEEDGVLHALQHFGILGGNNSEIN